MKILAIVGTQLRHKYFLSKIIQNFNVTGIIFYKRTLVQPPGYDHKLFNYKDLKYEKKHLKQLAIKEEAYFKNAENNLNNYGLNIKTVSGKKELNSPEILTWVNSLKPDAMIDYGSGILSKPFLEILPEWKINLHGGLSPYYKGSATLFWPFYMQQPELAGITYHLLDVKIDGGHILQHFRPKMLMDDIVCDIGCRAIKDGADVGVKLLKKLKTTGTLKKFSQKHTGKLFLEKDYKPGCVKIVYQLFNNGLIHNYLENKDEYDRPYEFADQIGIKV